MIKKYDGITENLIWVMTKFVKNNPKFVDLDLHIANIMLKFYKNQGRICDRLCKIHIIRLGGLGDGCTSNKK